MSKLEEAVRSRLLDRGFKHDYLLNNRGLIGAVIEEVLFFEQTTMNDRTDKAARDEAAKHEAYHLEGMSGKNPLTIEFSAMCCGNSFYDGYEWAIKNANPQPLNLDVDAPSLTTVLKLEIEQLTKERDELKKKLENRENLCEELSDSWTAEQEKVNKLSESLDELPYSTKEARESLDKTIKELKAKQQ